MMLRDILRFEMNFGDAVVIAGDEAVENFREPQASTAVDAAHDTEIDCCDPAVLQREQIALVEVSVEIAVDDGLSEECPDERRGQRLRIVACG